MTKSVQSVSRALQVLEYLNQHSGGTVREISTETGLSRGTVFRLLETLRNEGYLRKDSGSPAYWLTGRVRALSDGYQEEWWIDEFAKQVIDELGAQTKWPVKLLTLSGYEMLTRVTTDFQSPLTDGKIPTGFRVSLLWTAAGRVVLAFSPANVREALVNGCQTGVMRVGRARRRVEKLGLSAIESICTRIRKNGYEIVDQEDTQYYSLAVPVIAGTRVVGALAIFFFRASIKQGHAVTTFKPMLDQAAKVIGDRFPA
ncbi:MAG: helix-turn-helix domain-containing protein [Rhodobacteraceae bacterium]|nr:helix-turn-helix domain-containing protein [Paracoccaceae bacterium]